jgi:hypothetical protein
MFPSCVPGLLRLVCHIQDPSLIFDNPMFLSVAFHPRVVPRGESSLPAESFIDGVVGGCGYRLYKHPSGAARPVVVYFHGNAEVATDYDYSYTQFHDAGASLLVLDFLGYGWSRAEAQTITGLPATSDALLPDLRAALGTHGLVSGQCVRPCPQSALACEVDLFS